MLFPFDERHLTIPALHASYLPSVLADLEREAFSGHMVVLTKERSLTVTLSDGYPVSNCEWRVVEGLDRLPHGRGRLFLNLPDVVAVEILEADDAVVAMTRLFSRAQPSWRMTTDRNPDELSAELSRHSAAVVARRYDGVCELAFADGGELKLGYRFNGDTASFERVGPQTWLQTQVESSIWEVVPVDLVTYPEPDGSGIYDPLGTIMEKYVMVLDLLGDMLRRLDPKGGDSVIASLLEIFKQKYPPLYRGVYLNPETGHVNWDWLMTNRDKVNILYRYEKFLLYLDELLLQYTQLFFDRFGVDGIARLREAITELKAASPDKDDPLTRRFFRKLDQVLKKS